MVLSFIYLLYNYKFSDSDEIINRDLSLFRRERAVFIVNFKKYQDFINENTGLKPEGPDKNYCHLTHFVLFYMLNEGIDISTNLTYARIIR